MSTPSPIIPDHAFNPRRYLRFLLRQGEERGRRFAVLLPGVCYFVCGIYPMLVTGAHVLLFEYTITSSELTTLLVVAGMGLGGAALTSLILWRKSDGPQRPVRLWSLCLTMPLLTAMVIGASLGTPDTVGGVERWAHILVLSVLAVAGYFRLTLYGSFWPTHRSFLYLYPSPGDAARDKSPG